jgi:hypothetical protein
MKEAAMDDRKAPLTEGAVVARRVASQWVAEAEAEFDLIPLALIALEVDEPVGLVADRLGDVVQLDDVGLRAIPSAAAREFLTARAEQAARMADQSRRLQEAHKPSPVGRGVPSLSDDASPFESLMAAESSHYETPAEEFGRPAPRFLQEEIEQGARQAASARAEAEAKKGKGR